MPTLAWMRRSTLGPARPRAKAVCAGKRLSGDTTSGSAGGSLQGRCAAYRRTLRLAARSDVIDANLQTHAGRRLPCERMLVYFVRGNHQLAQLRYADGNTRGDEVSTQASATHTVTVQTPRQL